MLYFSKQILWSIGHVCVHIYMSIHCVFLTHLKLLVLSSSKAALVIILPTPVLPLSSYVCSYASSHPSRHKNQNLPVITRFFSSSSSPCLPLQIHLLGPDYFTCSVFVSSEPSLPPHCTLLPWVASLSAPTQNASLSRLTITSHPG